MNVTRPQGERGGSRVVHATEPCKGWALIDMTHTSTLSGISESRRRGVLRLRQFLQGVYLPARVVHVTEHPECTTCSDPPQPSTPATAHAHPLLPRARKSCSNDSPECAEDKDEEATGVAHTLTNARSYFPHLAGRREL